MATNNSINSNIPIEITKGGTAAASFTAYTPLCGGTTSTNPLQSVSSVGSSPEVLTSQGAGALPLFQLLPTFFSPVASDPASPAPGDVWYNTTTDLFKGCVSSGAGLWVVKASMSRARQGDAGAGSGASGFVFGGTSVIPLITEHYDGTGDTWTTRANYNGGISYLGGAGTYADALAFGGVGGGPVLTTTRRYDSGTNTWTNKTGLNTARSYIGGSGTAADALSFGGNNGGGAVATVERYDGGANTWTAKTSMNSVRSAPQGAGTASDTLVQGGLDAGGVALITSERYDGVGNTWTNKTSASVIRAAGAAAGADGGNMMIYGGMDNVGPTVYTSTELYDGVGNSWSTIANLNDGRYYLGGCGNTSDALAMAGRHASGGALAVNERFMGSSTSIVTFTVV